MKIIIFILFISIQCKVLIAQESKNISIEMLKAPNSPASLLLGIDESQIQRPTSTTNFVISLKQATQEFTSIPNDYAIDLAPVWLFNANHISYDDFAGVKSNKIENNIPQSWTLSIATTLNKNSADSNINNRMLAFGTNISVFRGEVNNDFKKKMQAIEDLLKDHNKTVSAEMEALKKSSQDYQEILMKIGDPTISDSDRIKYAETLTELETVLKVEAEKSVKDKVERIVRESEDLDMQRIGWKLDFSTGLSLDYPNNNWGYSNVETWGLWFTGGYESKNFTALGVIRYLSNPNGLDSGNNNNVNNLDLGVRGICNPGRFSFSLESIYRNSKVENTNSSKWRFNINLSYEIFSNKLLTFNMGKEFDKNIETGGNLIAALGLILGFGSDRNISF